ncbi:sulfotransferase family protein [Fulvivirga sedimenti]|uniref:Sulfotransferase n=1 Tax=Fulvivirga sedimenti TaxID=2879465 RepID=A0A9X1HM94_9BACT|nr:sulfotransferase [Fulvivirga sedimenti]MCA6073433.1 sulfotransferase [Fulvivirga sedimenti]
MSTNESTKIFLLGSERSGSNLLRSLLGRHKNISAPIAGHLSDVFYGRFHYYLPLSNESKRELLLDLIEYLNHPFNDWKIERTFDLDALISSSHLNNFIQFQDLVHRIKAGQENKDHYFSKDNHNHRYALGYLQNLTNVKFIYLVRDPRDQIASWMRTPIYLHTPHAAVLKWKQEQNDIIRLSSFYGVDMKLVKYEDLVDDSRATMTSILKFLNLPIDENCFNTDPKNKEASKHPFWKNINKPIKSKNYGKYRDVLTEGDVNLIETIAKWEMNQLNYSLVSNADWKKPNYYLFRLNEKIKSRLSRRKNKDFLEKEMKILFDKHSYLNSLFDKFDDDSRNKAIFTR